MNATESLAFASVCQSLGGASTLADYVKGEASIGEVAEAVPQLLDAAKLAIEVSIAGRELDSETGQVYAALCKFLEGWA